MPKFRHKAAEQVYVRAGSYVTARIIEGRTMKYLIGIENDFCYTTQHIKCILCIITKDQGEFS